MNNCQKMREKFADAILGELPTAELSGLENHLADCAECAGEYEAVRLTLEEVNAYNRPELDDEYWECFTDHLEERIDLVPSPGRIGLERVRNWAAKLFQPLPGTLRPALAGAALLVIGIVIGRTFLSRDGGVFPPPAGVAVLQPESQGQGYARAASYFGRAKLVLLGIVNYDTETGELLPVSLERQVQLSRDLVDEIPVLRAELDPRADAALLELISELETVLLQTANLESGYGIIDIQLIQQGAQRKALLFKIDMGEIILSRDAEVQKNKTVPNQKSGKKRGGSLS